MTLWPVFTLLIALASAIAALLVLQRGGNPASSVSGLEAYKGQLAEIERKKTLGLMDEKERRYCPRGDRKAHSHSRSS